MRRFATLTTTIIFAASLAFAQGKPPMKPKTKAEETAVRAMLTAPDPDSRIKAADELITKFADTAYKSYALYLEADSYYQKGDTEKAIVFGEQALDADASNYQAAVLVAKSYAVTTHVNDLDKADKLGKIDKFGKIALDGLATATKPNPQLPDAEWAKIKDDLTGQAYLALGMAAAYGNKVDDAKADFDKVATMDQDPTDLIRAGRSLLDTKKYAEAVVYFDKAANFPGAPDQIKTIANSDKARAQSMIKK
jgi:tetratricopeptide (TPR) repeat protein